MSAIPNMLIFGIHKHKKSFLLSYLAYGSYICAYELTGIHFVPHNGHRQVNSLHFSLFGIEFNEEIVDNKKRDYSRYLRFKTLNRLIYGKNARTLAKRYNKLSELREKRNTSYISINKTDLSLKTST